MVLEGAPGRSRPLLATTSNPLRLWFGFGLIFCLIALVAWYVPLVRLPLFGETLSLSDLEGGDRAFLLTALVPALLAAGGLVWANRRPDDVLPFGLTGVVFCVMSTAGGLGLAIEVIRADTAGGGPDTLRPGIGLPLGVVVIAFGLAAALALAHRLRWEPLDPAATSPPVVIGLLMVVVSRVWISSDVHLWSSSGFAEVAIWIEIAVIVLVLGLAAARFGRSSSIVALAAGIAGMLERIEFFALVPSGGARPITVIAIVGYALIGVAGGRALVTAAPTGRSDRG